MIGKNRKHFGIHEKQENENEWITFAQCFSCNRIATVGSKIMILIIL